jgi:maltooligosyltrehalose synthase
VSDLDALREQVIAALAHPRRAPHRLEHGPALCFEDVGVLAPYLTALGVSDADLSPGFKSGPGSSHGEDVAGRSGLNPEVGSR